MSLERQVTKDYEKALARILRGLTGVRPLTPVQIAAFLKKAQLMLGMEDKFEGRTPPEMSVSDFSSGVVGSSQQADTQARLTDGWVNGHRPVMRARNNKRGG